MAIDEEQVRATISTFLRRTGKGRDALEPGLSLYGEGLELDSLEAAELSAVLEDEYGRDPFSADGAMPETIGDVLDFYAAATPA